jgi:tripartite-type tricarboxylate transporter receptor subunit TctC
MISGLPTGRCAARLAYVVVVNPAVRAVTLPECIACTRANPGKVNYGWAGQGTLQNIACELFKMMSGLNLVHVPYKGGAPRNTPPEIIAMLNRELDAGLADSKIKARIVELGGTPLGGSPAEFGAIIAEATAKRVRVIKFAGITAD